MCSCSKDSDDLQKQYLNALYGNTFYGVCDGCEHHGPVSVRRSGAVRCISCAMLNRPTISCCGV